jgi:hypothetical protein
MAERMGRTSMVGMNYGRLSMNPSNLSMELWNYGRLSMNSSNLSVCVS